MHRSLLLLLFCMAPTGLLKAQFVGCDNIQQISREECEALEKFFVATEGWFWFNTTNWLRNNQPCTWDGLSCNSSPWPRKITGIQMNNNNVGGSLPPELNRLTELKTLIIQNSDAPDFSAKLSGAVPRGLGDLENLEVISLNHNALMGDIPFELARLKKLRILNLSNNQLLGAIPHHLGELESLVRLDLSHNDLSQFIPSALGQLDSLTHLILHSNRLSGPIPTELGLLKKLQVLDVHNNQLFGSIPAELGYLGNLSIFDLSGNNLSGPLPLAVAERGASLFRCRLMDNEADLCIPDTAPYQALGVDPICSLPLDAACSLCSNTTHIPEMECEALNVLYNQTEGASWVIQTNWLASMAPCTWFGVTCTDGTVTGLDLSTNNLAGTLPSSLGDLSNLNTLDLSANNLEGSIPEALGNLMHLSTLDLSSNLMSGEIPVSVAEIGAQASTCNFSDNSASLCFPDTAPYQALGANPICELPLSATCMNVLSTAFETFQGQIDGSDIILKWAMNQAVPNALFEIQERSEDGSILLGIVEGTASDVAFSFRITDPEPGPHRYRLKQIDNNGVFQYSPELEITFFSGDFIIEAVYPYPIRSTSTLRFTVASTQSVTVELLNVLGQRVRTLYAGPLESGQGQSIQLNAENLPKGMYLVRLIGENGSSIVQKIMVS